MMKSVRLLLAGLLISFILFLPSFGAFFTHDDFFHFRISQAASVSEVVGFFNLTSPPGGFGWYRPLTTQVFYYIGTLFGFNPFPLHVLLFLNYILVCVLVWYLIRYFSGSGLVAGLAGFLYAVSATHFAHLYFFSVQELGVALFYFLTVALFVSKQYWLSVASFLLALASKEMAVTLPIILILVTLFEQVKSGVGFSVSGLKKVLPFFFVLIIYFYFRFAFYGFAVGDSYVWSISPRVLNSLAWYTGWAFNLPELLVDFIGPGIRINPNLMNFWGREIAGILVFIVLSLIILLTAFIMMCKNSFGKSIPVIILGLVWFVSTLFPVLFLPWHKFAFYLTIPLLGLLLSVGTILEASRSRWIQYGFLGAFLGASVITVSLTAGTHWITSGQKTAASVNSYVKENINIWSQDTLLVFYDTPADDPLPWSPALTVKTVLSDNNYFTVFTKGKISAVYLTAKPDKIDLNQVIIPARQFLGY